MSVIGIIEDGKVVVPQKLELPNGTKVRIEPIQPDMEPPSVGEDLKSFIGIFDDLPADLARNHDHYIHGLPKK